MNEVSVVIPTFNCAKYITEAIESLLKQTYKKLDIIVVDDGSMDDTKTILHPYIEKGIVNYIYQDNQGPGAARNTGIKCAKGDYIAFLDADDTLTEDSIERRMNLILSSSKVGLVFSDYFYETEEFKSVESDFINKIQKLTKFIHETYNGLLFKGSFQDVFSVLFLVHTGTVLVRKEVFEKAGFFRSDISIGEDRDMWLRIAEHYEIGFVNEPLAYYKRFISYLTVKDPLGYGLQRISYFNNLINKYQQEKSIRKFLYKRLAIPYFDLAVYFHQENRRIKFIENILKSIYYNHWEVRPYRFITFSLIPNKMRKIIKKWTFRK